ncbi:DUF2793 domain-containing protein [Thioclava sp. GXIMD4216]|uniref:DUF2793 domain-containing protein n=1 Tax=Thioclava sp. GXIMD4216 TaxID=3131929 RepID=UPI0030CDBE2A
MTDSSANLDLPFIQASQAQKHVTHNEAIDILDTLVQLSVQSRTTATPPATPSAGHRYILPQGAAGAWAGHDGAVVQWGGEAWRIYPPKTGWQAYIADEAQSVIWTGTHWAGLLSGALEVERLGVNSAADETNRLAVASDATLLTHAGTSHQLKINKALPENTASLVFQTGWSGRAEMGCAGNDAFAVKVSADGASWTTALSLSAATGLAMMPQGAEINGPLSGTAILGSVSQTAGALFERGETGDGAYFKLANGVLLCLSPDLAVGAISTAAGSLFQSAALVWTFPAAFAAPPTVTGALGIAGTWMGNGPTAATNCSVTALSYQSVTDGGAIRITALGRWF